MRSSQVKESKANVLVRMYELFKIEETALSIGAQCNGNLTMLCVFVFGRIGLDPCLRKTTSIFVRLNFSTIK